MASNKQTIASNLSIERNVSSKIEAPDGYKGLAAFHKYWGKKPIECLSYLIESLTLPGEIIADPFIGSGLIAREALLKQRRVIGIDINPIAVELSRLVIDLPNPILLHRAIDAIEQEVKDQINQTYILEDDKIATHYLWEGTDLKSVWCVKKGKAGREERHPTPFDIALYKSYEDYEARLPRKLSQFHNSRINTTVDLSAIDLFTGRARRNIDLLIESINRQHKQFRRALLLSLTSASGQMSRMVFAITGRGKTKGIVSEKVEVGSWVIGYWRPHLHFEVNVWNCFYKRATGLVKAISSYQISDSWTISNKASDVISNYASAAIINKDARNVLDTLPADSLSLIITDPPHSDRIPYLELSDMWNAILGKDVDYEHEIVVSNARGREKTKSNFSSDMTSFLKSAVRVLQPGRFIAILFNARDDESWEFLHEPDSLVGGVQFIGCFPSLYSANSVVQDNRKGSLKSDFVLIYQKAGVPVRNNYFMDFLEQLPNWSTKFPIES